MNTLSFKRVFLDASKVLQNTKYAVTLYVKVLVNLTFSEVGRSYAEKSGKSSLGVAASHLAQSPVDGN